MQGRNLHDTTMVEMSSTFVQNTDCSAPRGGVTGQGPREGAEPSLYQKQERGGLRQEPVSDGS